MENEKDKMSDELNKLYETAYQRGYENGYTDGKIFGLNTAIEILKNKDNS